VEFYQKSRHWLTEEIAPRLRALGFSYRVKTYKGRYHRLVVYSKRFHDLLWQAWKTLPNSSREELISFVKGVADAEASVHRKYNRIVVWQKNQDTLEFVRAILEANGIKCGKFTRSRDVLGLPVYGRENLNRFYMLIGFRHPDKQRSLMRKVVLTQP
ncbi:MAG: LAGLIDADG family homing endonuclease, partial [Aigarchaeota archaeon]|nr:LAGLIDADG family homing endonuclease [Aigarchaeota archaeon]